MTLIFRAVTAFALSFLVLGSHGLAQSTELQALKADLQAAQAKARLAGQIADMWQAARQQERGR